MPGRRSVSAIIHLKVSGSTMRLPMPMNRANLARITALSLCSCWPRTHFGRVADAFALTFGRSRAMLAVESKRGCKWAKAQRSVRNEGAILTVTRTRRQASSTSKGVPATGEFREANSPVLFSIRSYVSAPPGNWTGWLHSKINPRINFSGMTSSSLAAMLAVIMYVRCASKNENRRLYYEVR